ncbi:unnamed protein product, partial [marine sediment metagenome]
LKVPPCGEIKLECTYVPPKLKLYSLLNLVSFG